MPALTLQQKIASQDLASYWLRLPKSDEAVLQLKLKVLLNEHEILRTEYGHEAGYTELRQQVAELGVLDWRRVAGDNAELLRHEALAVFAAQEVHLLAWYWPREDHDSVLLIAPSRSLDVGSALNIRRCLVGHAEHLLEDSTQYLDYGDWVSELQMSDDASAGTSFWRGQQLHLLPGAAITEQRGYVRDEQQGLASGKMQSLGISLTEQASQALLQTAQNHAADVSQVALALWSTLLGLVNGKEEFKVSYFYDCRNDYEELEDALGCFVMPLPMPYYQPTQSCFNKLLKGQLSLWHTIQEQQEYLGMACDLSDQVAQAGFAYQYLWESEEVLTDQPVGACKLLMQLTQTPQGMICNLHYDANRYRETTMMQLLQRYQVLLERALAQPEETLTKLDVFLPGEHSGFVNTDATLALTKQSFLEYWALSVSQYPQHQAARCDETVVTYQQLDQLSDQVAAGLQQRGAKMDEIVALCLPHSLDFLIALLGVLKSGAAYLPLDPEQPHSRRARILEDAQPLLCVMDADMEESALIEQGVSIAELQRAGTSLSPVTLSDQALAYVLYTSGTSGTPKGVQVSHGALSHYCQSAIHALQFPTNGHYALVSSPTADLGNTMLFPSWMQGGCLHLLNKTTATDAHMFKQYVERFPMDCLKIVPSHFMALSDGQVLNDILPRQVLVFGGEVISEALLSALAKDQSSCAIFNHYGPTETTVGVLWGRVDVNARDTRLQHVIGNNRVYLLDDQQCPVINGCIGELYIAGPNLSMGYLNQAELSDKAFIADPFVAEERMYRSGDLALQSADGALEILGRVDQQIKVRGFRMELGEVEATLICHEQIWKAHVLAHGEGEQKRLIAFTVGDVKQTEAELKTWLLTLLPDYMVPARIVSVERMPLSANGKVDRQTLLSWLEAEQQTRLIEPKNEMEMKILSIWKSVLGRENISTEDNFFDVGGHSLAAIKVIARLRRAFAVELAADIMFHKQTIVALAEEIGADCDNQTEYLVRFSQVEQAPTLVMMHSLGGHYQYYQPLIDGLESKVNLYGLLPDVALLAHSEAENLDEVMAHYADQLELLRGQPLVLVGWSLAGRMMMLLAQVLQERGFDIQQVAIIDFDPTQVLSKVEQEKQALLEDLQHYCTQQGWYIDETQWQEWQDELPNDYAQGLSQILAKPSFAAYLDNATSVSEFHDHVMMRWALKRMFYATPIPKLTLPLLVWSSVENAAPVSAWQSYSSQPLQGWSLDADHFGILAKAELAEQLISSLGIQEYT